MRGAGATIVSVMPVRTAMNGGIGSPGLTSVWNSPSTSPPRTFTAPISVIAHDCGLPPVVSRSTTTNVTSRSGVPSSSNVPWTATGWVSRPAPRTRRRRRSPLRARRPTTSCRPTLGLGSDETMAARRRSAGAARVAVDTGRVHGDQDPGLDGRVAGRRTAAGGERGLDAPRHAVAGRDPAVVAPGCAVRAVPPRPGRRSDDHGRARDGRGPATPDRRGRSPPPCRCSPPAYGPATSRRTPTRSTSARLPTCCVRTAGGTLSDVLPWKSAAATRNGSKAGER